MYAVRFNDGVSSWVRKLRGDHVICAVKWLPPFVLINESEKGLTNKNQ